MTAQQRKNNVHRRLQHKYRIFFITEVVSIGILVYVLMAYSIIGWI